MTGRRYYTYRIYIANIKDIDHYHIIDGSSHTAAWPNALYKESTLHIIMYHARIDDNIGSGEKIDALKCDGSVIRLRLYILAESSYVYKNNKPCCQLINKRITNGQKKQQKTRFEMFRQLKQSFSNSILYYTI